VYKELLSVKAKKLLVIECALLCVLAAPLLTLMFIHSYTFHFQQVTLNFYTNGKTDFTADATGLVRLLAMIAVLALTFGVTTGAAVGLTCSPHFITTESASGLGGYEEEMTKAGFVEISKTEEGTTYKLTDLGRRFLREYRFLEKTEENIA
jgi:hypothetical protein